ncbi:MAG TPA: glutathione S-transferase N-terminal domain-containing protein [Solirubrobacterales bacterium]|nr:glutathione S-transferase N-terminal domain-containing protein [Solirubrobacterales bacterium]
MNVKLYSIPGSHPAAAARAMLEHKGIEYQRVDLPPVVSRVLMRAFGFPGNRVPALKIDGRKVQGSRDISRELEVIEPDPPLFPTDPERRAAVEEAERWGDEVFQQMPRTITWWALKRHKSDQTTYLEGAAATARLGMPSRVAVATSGPILRTAIRLNDSTDETVRQTLASIGPALDRIDSWIEEGVLGSEQPNAADFQIAASVALLMTFDDVRERIEMRPAADLARRLYPWYPGRVRPSFPPEWLEPLRQSARA